MGKLFIVIPAFNEAANIEAVAKAWHAVAEQTDGELLIIDDGSRDETYARLQSLAGNLPRLTALTKANRGHGSTLLFGYRYALEHGADYVFQTDSDGQTLPTEFAAFWHERENYDLTIGQRRSRGDGISRLIVTNVLRLLLFVFFHVWIKDANTPFRLMSAESLKAQLLKIPPDYFLANVLLTVAYAKAHARIRWLPVTFRERQGGKNSLNIRRIFRIGWRSLGDFWQLRKSFFLQEREVQ